MERLRRLDQLWSWLPAFRAVAETEHLPTASRALFVSPSALSRTVRLLEDNVGRPLFQRVGRRIELDAAGRDFLAHVRDAMRLIDEGLQRLESRQMTGAVHISCPGPFAPIAVLPALDVVAAEWPDLVGHVVARPSTDVPELLRQGHLDLAVLDDPTPAEGVDVEALGPIRHGVWCSPDHPLAQASAASLEAAAEHPFVAPVARASGHTPDAWPMEVPRRITLRVSHMYVALEAVRSARLLAVLPDPVAAAAGLHRVPVDVAPTGKLYLLQRKQLPVTSRISVVADAIRAVMRPEDPEDHLD